MPVLKKTNYAIILNLLGILFLLNSFFMFLCVPVSLYYQEDAYIGLIYAGLTNLAVGLSMFLATKNAHKNVGKREGYLIVGIGWIGMALFGTLPYIFTIPQLSEAAQQANHMDFTNALFETMSGYTTTGASILNNI